MIQYSPPKDWIRYDRLAISAQLIAAKATVLSLTNLPYQRNWAEKLQEIQLKREVAGTSRIEGADFTERELDAAMRENPEQLHTRSQRQAAAAAKTYRWIATLPDDYPTGRDTILEVHRLIVTGADDDHCPPGVLRARDENVTFGVPRHRGVPGGSECDAAFTEYCNALDREMRDHDPLVRALAAHYHFAAMHPFLDGNGRTARAVEALLLQRCGLRDTLFIAMSNYYYDEKNAYLKALADVRASDHDLTPFLIYGLKGIEQQCMRLIVEIRRELSKVLFRDRMLDLFSRVESPKKRVVSQRQIGILKLLLERNMMPKDLIVAALSMYSSLKNGDKAIFRDLVKLLQLKAVGIDESTGCFFARLEWPTEITDTEFFKLVEQMPKAKTFRFSDH